MATLLTAGASGLAPVPGSLWSSGFKPWWEKTQSYCIYALFAINAMVFYITERHSSVTCTPSTTEASSLATPDANFVNSLCYSQIDGIFRNAGRNLLIGSVVLYLLNVWWELVPVVSTRFLTVKNADTLLNQQHLTKSEMKRLVTTPTANCKEGKSDAKVARDVCRRLYLPKQACSSPFKIYIARTLLSMGGICTALGLILFLSIKSIDQNRPTSNCTLDNETATALGVTDFFCSNQLPSQLATYFLAISVVLLIAFFMNVIGFFSSVKNRRSITVADDASNEVQILANDYALVKLFSRHSNPLHGSTKMALSLINNADLDGMKKNILCALKYNDKDFLRLFWRLYNGGKDLVRTEVTNIASGEDPNLRTQVGKTMIDFDDLYSSSTMTAQVRRMIDEAQTVNNSQQQPQSPAEVEQINGNRQDASNDEPGQAQIETGNQGSSPGGSPEHTQPVAPGARRKDRSSRGRPNGNCGPAHLPHGGHSRTTPLLQDDGSTYREEEELQNTAKNNRSKRQDPNLAGKTTSNQGPIVNITADRINQVNTGQTGGSSHYHDYDDSGAGGDSLGPQTHET